MRCCGYQCGRTCAPLPGESPLKGFHFIASFVLVCVRAARGNERCSEQHVASVPFATLGHASLHACLLSLTARSTVTVCAFCSPRRYNTKQGTGLKECIISGILSVDGKKVLLLTHQLSTRNPRQRSPCGQNCVHGSGWFECDRGRSVLWGTSACEEEVRSGALTVRARAFRA